MLPRQLRTTKIDNAEGKTNASKSWVCLSSSRQSTNNRIVMSYWPEISPMTMVNPLTSLLLAYTVDTTYESTLTSYPSHFPHFFVRLIPSVCARYA